MTNKLTWFGHAVLGLETGGQNLIVDPFFNGNPAATAKAEQISADFILVTHGHGDHVGDAVSIAKRTGATVIANAEICSWMGRQGVDNTHAQHIGGGPCFSLESFSKGQLVKQRNFKVVQPCQECSRIGKAVGIPPGTFLDIFHSQLEG